ncbi:unnamed protein product [Ilex paraguariensis]|uniref:Uncharacterized protein n=1 Tax=Ilex paraguariensis TaxID=185542 RepID=A0ABC8RT09_9AQUA
MAGAGRVVRNVLGQIIVGFYENLVVSTSLAADLWALRSGLWDIAGKATRNSKAGNKCRSTDTRVTQEMRGDQQMCEHPNQVEGTSERRPPYLYFPLECINEQLSADGMGFPTLD